MENHISTRGRGKGQWWPVETTPWHDIIPYGNKASKLSAIFYCPDCGEAMDLINHTIDCSGTVTPSVVEPLNPHPKCANERCGQFHKNITLEGWKS